MQLRLNSDEIKGDLGLPLDRMIAAPVFDSVNGRYRQTYEIPMSDVKFFCQYTYDAEIPFWDNADKCSLSIFQIRKGGYWGFFRREYKSMDAKSDPFLVDEIKIYSTNNFRQVFNTFIGDDERELLWTMIKLAGKAVRKEEI